MSAEVLCEPCQEDTRCSGPCDERICDTTGPGTAARCPDHVFCEDCTRDGWAAECRSCAHDLEQRRRAFTSDLAYDADRDEQAMEDAS